MINSFRFIPLTTAFTTSSKTTSLGTICAKSDSITYYHNGAGATPVSGDYVFADAAGTIEVDFGYWFIIG